MTSVTVPDNTMVKAEARGQTVLDRYRLLSRIGSGGFGIVWKAFDEKLERTVAVKEVAAGAGSEKRGRRADREAYAVARLSHPSIVALHEYGHEGNTTYLISELVDGQTFDETLAEGELSDRDIAHIGIDLCRALTHAHRAGVIHRDVKPQNVMVTEEDGEIRAKLMDFGVAHLTSGEKLTGTGDVVGTLIYMAPEQAKGRKISNAVDVYSLALTLYEAWSGQNPINMGSPMAALDRIGKRPPSIGRMRRDLPGDVIDVIDAGLDPDPEQRPQLTELSETLEGSSANLDGVPPERPRNAQSGFLTKIRSETDLDLIGRGVSAAVVASLAAATAILGQLSAGEVAAITVFALLAGFALPRLSWITAAAAAIVAVFNGPGPGAALVSFLAVAPVPLLLTRHGRLWSLPALVLPLGAAGLGPLFLAVTGVVRNGYTRAATAAIAAWWLSLAEVVTGSTMYLGPPSGTWSFERWQGSATTAFEHAVLPLLAGPIIAVAVLWAASALVLPYLIRGRGLVADTLGAVVWGTAFVMASRGLGELYLGTAGTGEPKGTIVAALVVVLTVGAFHLVRQSRTA